MLTVTVPRTDLTTDEVATVLRDGLGAGYHVLPGMGMGQLPFQGHNLMKSPDSAPAVRFGPRR